MQTFTQAIGSVLYYWRMEELYGGLPEWPSGKESASAGDTRKLGFDSWVGKIPWRRKRKPTPYSCLENSMDRGAWWAIVHGSQTAGHDGAHTAQNFMEVCTNVDKTELELHFPEPLDCEFLVETWPKENCVWDLKGWVKLQMWSSEGRVGTGWPWRSWTPSLICCLVLLGRGRTRTHSSPTSYCLSFSFSVWITALLERTCTVKAGGSERQKFAFMGLVCPSSPVLAFHSPLLWVQLSFITANHNFRPLPERQQPHGDLFTSCQNYIMSIPYNKSPSPMTPHRGSISLIDHWLVQNQT